MLALPALIHRANQNREHMTKYRAYASTVFTTPASWNATPGDRPILQGSTIKSAFENTSLYAIPLQVGELTFTAESVKNDTILAIAQGVSPTSAKVLTLLAGLGRPFGTLPI